MQSAAFLTTRRQLLLGMAGAALASAKVRNGMYNPEIAVHTSTWLVEAKRRKRPLADMVDEALSTSRAAGYRRVELASDFLAAASGTRPSGCSKRTSSNHPSCSPKVPCTGARMQR
jgi:hypothetical protein